MIQRMRIGNDSETYMPVYVKAEDRYKIVLIVGKTGGGKSQELLNVSKGDSSSKVARILIDPSGFLARDAYSVGGGHYCSLLHPLGLNPMLSPYRPHQIADLIADTINQMVTLTTPNEKFTVKMREILDAEVVRCLERGQTTLEEVKANIEAQRGGAETRDGIVARLNLILSDPEFKHLICGDGFEINKLIDRQETLILDCSAMSTSKRIFIGTLATNLVKSYFLYSRPKIYKPLIFTIDEAHNFVSPDFSLVLKEGRKYQIATILATTDFSMMPKPLIHTILSNAGTLICLRAGHVEAQMISNEFTTITAEDIKGLEKYHAAVKTPDGEYIVKLPRPLYVKQVPIKTMKHEPKTFGLKWFDIDPAYSFHLPTIGDAPPVVDHRQGSD